MLRKIISRSSVALGIAVLAMSGTASPTSAATTSDHTIVAKQQAKKAGSFNCNGTWYSRTSTSEGFGGGQFRWTLGAASYNDRAVIVESTDGRGANFWIYDKLRGGAYVGIGPNYGTRSCLQISSNSKGADFTAARGGQRWSSGFWLV